VAPEPFVNQLWQAARRHGVDGALRCPSCTQPLTVLGPDVLLHPSAQLCLRCFLVWLDQQALSRVPVLERPSRPEIALGQAVAFARLAAQREMRDTEQEAKAVLLLTAWAIHEVLGG
jgi:hypothetical protein